MEDKNKKLESLADFLDRQINELKESKFNYDLDKILIENDIKL